MYVNRYNPISIREGGRLCPTIGFASPKFFRDYGPEVHEVHEVRGPLGPVVTYHWNAAKTNFKS